MIAVKVLSYMIYHQPLLCFLQKHVLFIIRNLNENNVTNALAFIVFDFVKSEKKQQCLNYLTRLAAYITQAQAQMSEMTNYLECITYVQTLRRNNFTKCMDNLF